jgi:hypothetical protein
VSDFDAFFEKHQPVFQNIGRAGDFNYCDGCKGPNGTLIQTWPCEVLKLLKVIDKVDKMSTNTFLTPFARYKYN